MDSRALKPDARLDEFNFVDQSRIAGLELKSGAEGHLDSWTFEYGASGPFGRDILNSPWKTYDCALSRERSHLNRSEVDPITDGWFRFACSQRKFLTVRDKAVACYCQRIDPSFDQYQVARDTFKVNLGRTP